MLCAISASRNYAFAGKYFKAAKNITRDLGGIARAFRPLSSILAFTGILGAIQTFGRPTTDCKSSTIEDWQSSTERVFVKKNRTSAPGHPGFAQEKQKA